MGTFFAKSKLFFPINRYLWEILKTHTTVGIVSIFLIKKAEV